MHEQSPPSALSDSEVSHCFLPAFLLLGLGATDRAAASARGGRRTPFVGARAPYGRPIRARVMPARTPAAGPFVGARRPVGYPYRPY